MLTALNETTINALTAFSNFDINSNETLEPTVLNNYPSVVKLVMEHIITRKINKDKSSLVDIISDFCVKNKISVELVGDAIASDEYFKIFIASDQEFHACAKYEW